MAIQNIDPQQVTLVVGVIPIVSFQDGTFITVERNNDSFNHQPGINGGSRSKNGDRSGRITFILLQGAPENALLQAQLNTDELTGNGIVPVSCLDTSTGEKNFSEEAWIVRPANREMANTPSGREWIVEADVLEFLNINV